ncbi:peptidylprolyl isomerase [Candidatus Acidulodesulfobacterium sp. H_13]|uniref:peptidylprolyl isomerase n=1 Tax=Candidatus Acidulodesulfobacterium sp. H_13 TaxID=3395470 RepID=UPI003AF7C4AD
MKKIKGSILFIALFSVAISAGLYGCAKKQSVSPKIIASVNGNPITLPMLKDEMSKFPSALRVYLETPSGEKRLLKSLVDRQVLVSEALKKGINESKAYRAKVLDFKKGLLVQMLLHEEIKNKVANVTVGDAKAYYKKHYLNFNVPSKINASYIQTKSLKQAELAYKMLKNGKPFSAVVQKYSIAPNAKKGGVLGWIKFQETTPAFNNAAFSIPKVGDISRIVKVGNSFDIIKLNGIVAGKSKPFSAIKNEIIITMKQKSASKILKNFVKKLRAKSKIKYFYNNLPLAGSNFKNKKKAAPVVGKKQG